VGRTGFSLHADTGFVVDTGVQPLEPGTVTWGRSSHEALIGL
jgi:hypothetical protein